MRHATTNDKWRALVLLLAALGLTATGCTSLVEDIASHLAEKDVKALDHEFQLVNADLGLFRQCLKERGGACQGSDRTALPHSSQDAGSQAVTPVSPGPGQTLADSVAKLPAGHPAKDALAVMGHPMVSQAAALHDHLRGHDTVGVEGFSVEKGQGAHGGPESTATMSLGIGHAQQLHGGLLSSLGSGSWDSLHGHCEALLAAPGEAPARSKLEADCRRVAFIRGYLAAYTRHGELLEVDLQLAGAIRAVQEEGARLETDIDGLLAELNEVAAGVAQTEAEVLRSLSADAGKVGSDVEALVQKVEVDLEQRFGKAASEVFSDLAGLTTEIGARSEALAQAADQAVGRDVQALVSDLDGLLGKLEAALQKLDSMVASADQKVVQGITDELGKADQALSNVFKVSNVGFVSRDHTFQARLPTIEVTLDPTVRQMVKVTNVDTGQVLTGASDLGDLGVATDTSGVGTGASIGAEIVRVFLEAVFDAHEGLPAVAPANQPNVKPTGLTLGDYSLPLFTAPMGHVSAGDLSRMSHTNDQVAAGTKALVSRIIAGIGPFSLNNPPLEEFLVEIIATSVRHATAKATWCWYACNLDQDIKTLEADAKAAVDDKVRAEEDKVKAEAAKVGGEVEAAARQAEDEVQKRVTEGAEHVKLRLKLTK